MNALRIDGELREPEGGPRWLWPLVGLVVIVVMLSGAGWWVLNTRSIAVRTATAVAPGVGISAEVILQATGYITARRRATVSTQITGTLTQVLIEAGDHVEKGQVIARLEDRALRAGLALAQAHVQAAQAQVKQSEAQLEQARADALRQDTLGSRGMIAKQAAELAHTAVATYSAQLDARRHEVDSARAQLAQARVNLDYTFISAPFSGVITEKAAQVGEILSPLSAGGGFTRTGVGTIVDMDSLEVEVDVNEAYIGQVKPEMPAEAVLDAYPDWKIPAHVIAIVPAADRGKATVKVRVALEQKDARLLPDMGVRVAFLGSKATVASNVPTGVLVPALAVVQRETHSVVFVLVDGKAMQRTVTPAAQDFGTMKLLLEGVKTGERVVLSPPLTMNDGSSVRIEDETP